MNFSKELKRLARENLAGNYRITMGALLITFAIPMIIEFPFSKLVESKAPDRKSTRRTPVTLPTGSRMPSSA